MKRSTVAGVAALFMMSFVFAGCATMKRNNTELQTLKTQVSDLESKVQQKDAEIDSLRQALSKTTEEKYAAAKEEAVATQVPSATQIQTALKNAGAYSGEVDGKIGTQTKKAIRAFQKEHKLVADGKVGSKTWAVLSPYLDKK